MIRKAIRFGLHVHVHVNLKQNMIFFKKKMENILEQKWVIEQPGFYKTEQRYGIG